jgi:hypothetical protein
VPSNLAVPLGPLWRGLQCSSFAGATKRQFGSHFRDSKITQVTDQDRTVTTESDAVIGQAVEAAGLLHKCFRLRRLCAAIPGRLRVGDFLEGPSEERYSLISGSTPDR